MADRFGVSQAEQSGQSAKTEQTRQSISAKDKKTERSRDELVIKNSDVASAYGDVLSLSAPTDAAAKTETTNETDEIKSDKNAQAEEVSQNKEKQAEELSDDEKQQVSKLQKRDAEVKAHEAAHLAAAGGLARGGASYEYQEGPDGNSYAVGGEVSIDTSPVKDDPEATIAKAQKIRNAALAPASPSSQDYKVASAASQMESQATQELAKSQQNSQDTDDPQNTEASTETGKQTSGEKQQTVSPKAVAKYAAQSLNMSYHMTTNFNATA